MGWRAAEPYAMSALHRSQTRHETTPIWKSWRRFAGGDQGLEAISG